MTELRAKRVKTPTLCEVALLDLVDKRYDQMASGELDPFTGPIRDQRGTIRLPQDARADWSLYRGMDWFVDNVKGSISGK